MESGYTVILLGCRKIAYSRVDRKGGVFLARNIDRSVLFFAEKYLKKTRRPVRFMEQFEISRRELNWSFFAKNWFCVLVVVSRPFC